MIFRHDEITLVVCDKSSQIGCNKSTVITVCCNHRADISYRINFTRMILEQNAEGKGTFNFGYCFAQSFFWISFVEFIDQCGGNFGIRLGNQFIRQIIFGGEIMIVLDDTIVDQCNLSDLMRVCIGIGNATMGCPAGVADSTRRIVIIIADGTKIFYFSDSFPK